jgi:hypothetical protein
MDDLEEIRLLRMKLKAVRPFLRDLLAAATAAEEALDRALAAQPKEGTAHEHEDTHRYARTGA